MPLSTPASIKDKTSAVASRISDAWSAVATRPSRVGIQELRLLLAGHDELLSDLQDEQRVVAEDATIHVKTKRKRSPSPNLQASAIPHYRVVRAFLERRTLCETLEARIGDSDPLSNIQSGGSHDAYDVLSSSSGNTTTTSQRSSPTTDASASSVCSSTEVGMISLATRQSSQSDTGPRVNAIRTVCGPSNRSLAIPPHLKLPIPRPTFPNGRVKRPRMPCTLDWPYTYELPKMKGTKQKAKDVVLPRLSSIHKSEYGARLGLFAWPERLPQRIYNQLLRRLKVKGIKPLPQDFKNSRGLLRCPFCREPKEFVQVTRFTKHLWDKH
ncbi:hypothetical protein H9Q69_008305 [Fusarium xylarioides]|nr:hypothetical protein H9Q69_008305 [Fusarium xylarioides]